MRLALLSLTVLMMQVSAPAFGRVPELNLQALCKARFNEAKIARLSATRSVADCVSDETDAKQQLSAVWETTASSIRNQCQSETAVLGTKGYLDLFACVQIANDAKSLTDSRKTKGKN